MSPAPPIVRIDSDEALAKLAASLGLKSFGQSSVAAPAAQPIVEANNAPGIDITEAVAETTKATPPATTPPSSLLDWALYGVNRGWFIFPCVPGGKEPAGQVVPNGVLDASNDPNQIRAWWTTNPNFNPGVALGPSNLVVFDYDAITPPPEHMATFVVRSGRNLRPGQEGGFHCYYQGSAKTHSLFVDPVEPTFEEIDSKGNKILYDDLGRKVGKKGVAIGEVRSRGAYVVAPGAIHPSGNPYTIIHDVSLLASPEQNAEERIDVEAVGTEAQEKIAEFVAKAFDESHIDYKSREAYNAGFKWLIDCPWSFEHSGGLTLAQGGSSSAVIMLANGALNYTCQHAHCEDREWKDLREWMESVAGHRLQFTDGKMLEMGNNAPGANAPAPGAADANPLTNFGSGPEEIFVERMSDVIKKKLLWLWKDRIPVGTITTLAGEPDEGKSLVTLYVAACITRGIPFYGEEKAPAIGEVLLLCAEDDAATTLAPRLEAAGADLSKVKRIDSVMLKNGEGKTIGERLTQLDEDLNHIQAVLDKNPRVKLIIIDPISSFLGSASIVKEQEVRQVLGPLVKLCQQRKLTVILVAHFNKNSETRSALDRVGGAKALVGLGRASWTCVREPKDDSTSDGDSMKLTDPERRMFLKLKGNLVPSSVGGLLYTIRTKKVEVLNDETDKLEMVDIPYIMWLGKTDATAQGVVIDGLSGRPKTKLELCAEWLKGYLDEVGQAWRSDVMKMGSENGYGEKMLERALGTLRGYRSVQAGRASQWLRPGVQKDENLPQTVVFGNLGQPGKRNTVTLQ